MAVSIHGQKIKEGDKFMEEGEKCLKTGIFKWSPNYEGAAQAFSRAGLSYKMGKAYEQAEKAYSKSSTAYWNANSLFYSAKALEDAAAVCKESQKFDDAVEYLKRASNQYRENGNPDTAGMVMEKAAKTMEYSQPDKAAALYLEVASLHDTEEKHREASNSLRKALNMFLRSGKLPEAIKTTHRLERAYQQVQGWQNIHQVIAVKVLLHLHNGDIVEANQVYSEAFSITGFDNSDEAAVIERLLGAFGEGDEEEIVKCTTDPVYKCMDNDVAKFAKSLKPKVIDLNYTPPSSKPTATKQLQEDDTTAGNQNTEEDERSQLFAVTKHKTLTQPAESTAVTAGGSTETRDVEEDDASDQDDDDKEILDIN